MDNYKILVQKYKSMLEEIKKSVCTEIDDMPVENLKLNWIGKNMFTISFSQLGEGIQLSPSYYDVELQKSRLKDLVNKTENPERILRSLQTVLQTKVLKLPSGNTYFHPSVINGLKVVVEKMEKEAS